MSSSRRPLPARAPGGFQPERGVAGEAGVVHSLLGAPPVVAHISADAGGAYAPLSEAERPQRSAQAAEILAVAETLSDTADREPLWPACFWGWLCTREHFLHPDVLAVL